MDWLSQLQTGYNVGKEHISKGKSSSRFFILAPILALLYASPAYAYLDPGSGGALIGTITATIGALWYSIKSLFYRLTDSKQIEASVPSQTESLVLFSEGKAYWGTFRPLVAELIRKEIPFRYRTLDLYDPV